MAALMPGSTEEIQAIVKTCNRYRIKFKPLSSGWGPFNLSKAPNSIQLDLRRMNRILEIDEKNLFAVVEPYVTGSQLQAEVMKYGLNCHIIGENSVVYKFNLLATCIQGSGYKKDIDDIRESPAMDVIRLLEQQTNDLPPGLLKRGLELITYQFSRSQIEQVLRREALKTYNQYLTAHKILQNMARLAPVLGLAGTLIQLIRVFENSSHYPDLFRTLAFALLSTFYGLILASLLFIPLANKLKEFMEQDRLRMEIIQEGLMGIYDQEHPRAIQNSLDVLGGHPDAAVALFQVAGPPRNPTPSGIWASGAWLDIWGDELPAGRPFLEWAHFYLGRILNAEGEPDGARAEYSMALRIVPGFKPAAASPQETPERKSLA
jgi:biopolymer transport protein ExbB/TolQ